LSGFLPQDDAHRGWLAAAWAGPVRVFRIPVGGLEIAVRGWNLERTDLPGLLLVHGYRGHARWWDHVGPQLTARHRVAAFDLSGMGDSDRRSSYSRTEHGREVLAVADALGFDDLVIAAHSYGGVATLLALRDRPERARHAIIIDSSLPLPEEPPREPVPEPARRVYPTEQAALDRFRLLPPGRWPDLDILRHIAEHSIRQVDDGWTWKFDPALDTATDDDRRIELMAGVATPCRFVYGELSEVGTPERLRQIEVIAPRAGAPILIPASHHHVMIEQPLALVTVLRTLLHAA
jgi:pimeloyl-ACP methyl ester carboxylesterase